MVPTPPEDPDSLGPGSNPYLDEGAVAERAAETGALFDDAYQPDEAGLDAGLIAGSPEDPVLVAGVGYPLLGDLAVGTVVAYVVAEWDLPGVAVADCSNTPIAAYQTITEGAYEHLLVVGPEKRGSALNDGEPSANPGAIHSYDGSEFEMPTAELVELIGESAMGSNTVENVIVVTRALGELPADTQVLTVEPGYDSWGLTVEEFTEPVEAVLDEVIGRALSFLEATRS